MRTRAALVLALVAVSAQAYTELGQQQQADAVAEMDTPFARAYYQDVSAAARCLKSAGAATGAARDCFNSIAIVYPDQDRFAADVDRAVAGIAVQLKKPGTQSVDPAAQYRDLQLSAKCINETGQTPTTYKKCIEPFAKKYPDPAAFESLAKIQAGNNTVSKAIKANRRPEKLPTVEPLLRGAAQHLPDPERLLKDLAPGATELETASRRYAALAVLQWTTRLFARTSDIRYMEGGLAKKLRLYEQAMEDFQKPLLQRFAEQSCEGEACDRAKFYSLAHALERSGRFQEEVLTPYLPVQFQRAYANEMARLRIESDAQASEQMGKPGPLEMAWGVLQFLLWCAGIGGVLYLFYRGSQGNVPRPPPLSKNHGSAAFANPTGTPASQSASRTGVMLGRSYAPDFGPGLVLPPLAPVFTPPETHTLIVAPTRTGKGTRVIIPTLLRYGGAMLTIDPKGENAAITARARQALGQKIHIVNPWRQLAKQYADLGFPNAATYNPLDVLDPKDPNVVAIAQRLAETISPTVDDSKAFWTGNAANLLAAVFLWLTDRDGLFGETKTLARARHIVTLSRKEFTEKFLTQMMASEAFDHAIAEMVRPFSDLAPESYSGIIATLGEATKFLSDPQVKESTATSSFSMKDLMAGKTTVYLVIPPDRMSTHRTWLRLVLTAAMQTFKQHRLLTPPTTRAMFLVDEFPALGTIKDIPKEIATISGYGLDMTLIIQGLDQIEANYGKGDAATILNNCASKWFCNIGDLTTAKYVSESLGKKTVSVKTEGHSENVNQNPGGQGSSSGKSTNFSEMGRLLLTPEELLTLGRNRAVVIRSAASPLYLQPVDYWDLGQTFAYLRETYPGLYWNPPLIYDRNPYIHDDKGQTGGGQSGAGRSGGGHSGSGSGGQKRQPPGPSEARMTDEKARSILGVGPKATPDEIRKAYKRLMGKFHPDREGSTYLAQQINAAKAFLLGE